MKASDLAALTWRKSTRSGVNGNCVEVATLYDAVAVRDSKSPSGPALVFAAAEWTAFVRGAKAGGLDLS